jgi:hypothetical protein
MRQIQDVEDAEDQCIAYCEERVGRSEKDSVRELLC